MAQMTAYLEGLGYASYLVGEHDLLHLTPGSLAGIGNFRDWSASMAKRAGRRGVAPAGHFALTVATGYAS